MTCEHESWDSQMASHIDDIHCEVTGDIQFAIGGITQSLQRYGCALLSGLGRAAERSVTADELVELAAHLGTVVPQSPRTAPNFIFDDPAEPVPVVVTRVTAALNSASQQSEPAPEIEQ